MDKGRFIVFEGLDGSGKTTAMEGLAARLKAENPGRKIYMTREPSDASVGKLIRQALTHQIVLQPKTFTLLFAADRYEHVVNEVLPALERGEDVFCDRYFFSNLAYQGDVVAQEQILSFNALARELITPDLVFFVDTPPEECMRRIHKARSQEELFERLDKLKSTEALYRNAFSMLESEEHIEIIDGMLPKEAIVEKMYGFLSNPA